MEPQEQGLNEPNLSSGQDSVAWWQPPDEPNSQLMSSAQPVIPQINTAVGGSQSQLRTISSAPLQAKDADLVEKEWVEAVKAIMERYKSDPYNKNQALTLLRADYLKKRYNKDVKIPEN